MDIQEKINALLAAPSCCADLKEKANQYLAAEGEAKKAAAEALVKECEEDICSLEDAHSFFVSDRAAAIMGKAEADRLAAHAEKLMAKGVTTCFCNACKAAQAIIDIKDLL